MWPGGGAMAQINFPVLTSPFVLLFVTHDQLKLLVR